MTAGISPASRSDHQPVEVRVRAVQTGADFRAVVQLRTVVFGDEQGLVGPDAIDDDDDRGLHAMAEIEERGRVILAGTGRLALGSSVDPFGQPRAQIAWVATLPRFRGRGIGSAVMRFLLAEADALGSPSVLVSAQVHAMGLYRRLGFEPSGPPFKSGGIKHQLMIRSRGAASL